MWCFKMSEYYYKEKSENLGYLGDISQAKAISHTHTRNGERVMALRVSLLIKLQSLTVMHLFMFMNGICLTIFFCGTKYY